jgi:hypothetical protein
VLSLFAINRQELVGLDLIRPAVVALLLAFVVVLFARVLTKSSKAAAAAGSIFIAGILIYNFVFLNTGKVFGLENITPHFLTAWLIFTTTAFVLMVLHLRRTSKSLNAITLVLNVFAIAVVTLAMVPLVEGLITSSFTPGKGESQSPDKPGINKEWVVEDRAFWNGKEKPDVYYLVLDGYARGDVLQSRFGFDNSPFLTWLEEQGFMVGSQSHANYPWTHLSLSATLNGEFLQTLVSNEVESHAPEEYRSRSQFFVNVLSYNYVKHSRVHNFFTGAGYNIFFNNTEYTVTGLAPTSVSEALFGGWNEFERNLVNRTVFSPLMMKIPQANQLQLTKHGAVIDTLKQFGSATKLSGPKFVFYHLLSPHAPFCFDENGGMLAPHPVFDQSVWLEDRVNLPGYRDYVLENYPNSISGLNVLVKNAVSNILKQAGGNAVIILQSDHGSPLNTHPRSANSTDVQGRFGVLNAIYLPERFSRLGLSGDMSLVNTFRVVFSNLFQMDLPSLKNRAFYSTGDLEFEEVTQRLQGDHEGLNKSE